MLATTPQTTDALYNEYMALLNATRFDDMLRLCQQAQFEAELEEDSAMNAVALMGISYAYVGKGDFASAETYAQRSHEAAVLSEKDKIICDALTNLGGLAIMARAHYALGREKLLLALEIARDIRYERGIAFAQQLIGSSYLHEGQMPQALKHLQEGLRHANDSRTRAFLHNTMGMYYLNSRQALKAEEHFTLAVEYCRLGSDRMNEVTMLTNIGLAHTQQIGFYSFQKAFEHYQQALQLAQEVGFAYGEAATLHALGSAYLQLLEHEKAVPYFEQVHTLATKSHVKSLIVLSLDSLRECYVALKQYDRAVEQTEAMIALMEDNPAFQIDATVKQALVYRAQGDFTQAYATYRKSLDLCRTHQMRGRANQLQVLIVWWTLNDLPRILVHKLRGKR